MILRILRRIKLNVFKILNTLAVFYSPPGYSNTNNPIESYSKSIKAYFTNKEKMHFIPAFKIFQELVVVEWSKSFDYKSSIEVNKTQENKRKKLDSTQFCKLEATPLYEYNDKNVKINFKANVTTKIK